MFSSYFVPNSQHPTFLFMFTCLSGFSSHNIFSKYILTLFVCSCFDPLNFKNFQVKILLYRKIYIDFKNMDLSSSQYIIIIFIFFFFFEWEDIKQFA